MRRLSRVTLVAWSLAAVLHAACHVLHLDGFSTGDGVAQTISLLVVLALPALAIWVVRRDVPDFAV